MEFRKKHRRKNFFKRKKQQIEQPEQKQEQTQETKNEVSLLEELESQPVKLEFEKIDVRNDKERISYLERMFEAIQEAKRQCGLVKSEYGQVTSYLKDIQLIDQAPDEEKTGLLAAARQIVELTEERKRLQRQTYKMTDAQKHALENYEYKVDEDIKKLRGYEDYQMKIRNDLRQLSSEKNLLLADKREIIQRQHALKTIGKCLAGILVAIGAMLLALVFCFKVDITLPFVLAVVFAFVMAAIILNEARKNRLDMAITEKKCSRAVMLGNRVKIKYVNNTRTIDYMCHKYQIRNAVELEFVYGEYRKAKKEWAKQRESTIRLNENNQILMHELERLGVKDREIWFSQAKALVEPKEMVEVRHDLNVRRQKLRDQMDYNTDIMEQCIEEMEKIRDESPDYAAEVETILSRAIG
jgi:VIT1/CCC1 family predicted Fe2+/Mn2+ transporter